MSTKGDITDTFDDAEDLARSIEDGEQGPWNDEAATFTDPAAFELQEQLRRKRETQQKKPETNDYHQRRLEEFQQRMLAKERAAESPAPSPVDEDPWGEPELDTWAESADLPPPAETPPEPAPPEPRQRLVGVQTQPPNRGKDHRKMIVAAAVAIGAVLIAGAAAYALFLA